VLRNLENLPLEVRWTIAGIFGLLVLASVAARILGKLRPQAMPGELIERIRTWWVMVIVFTIALVLSRAVSLAFFALVSFLSLKEFFSLIPTRRADRRVLFWAYLAIPFQYYWAYDGWYGMFIVFIPVYMFLLLPMRAVMIGQTDGFLRSISTIQWGLMTMVFSISHAAYLLVLRFPQPGAARTPIDADWVHRLPGPGLLLTLVLLTQANDVAQYCWGKALGRRTITPTVSPNKTWGGFIGGLATTIPLAALLGPWLTPLTLEHSLWAGALIGISGFIGDVVISAVKRDLGVKDASTMLPGHGGVMDRVDSLTYTAPLFFHYVRYLYF
jgi:phosphatidate cytidylyltransferase